MQSVRQILVDLAVCSEFACTSHRDRGRGFLGEDDVSHHRAYNRILWPALSATIAVFAAALAFSPAAAAKWAGAEPCMSPNGLTLEQRYSYSFAIVTPECNE